MTVAEKRYFRDLPVVPPKRKKAKAEWLKEHYRYYTMSSVNLSRAPARCIKLSHLDIPREIEDVAYDMLAVDDYMTISGFSAPLNDWQVWWQHSYQWGTNGRSGGYIVMYHGQIEPSGYKSYCEECGQLNYAKVLTPPEENDLEGQLRKYVIEHNQWVATEYPKQSEVAALKLPHERVLEIVAEIRKEFPSRGRPNVTYHNRCGRCSEYARVNFTTPHMKTSCWPGKSVFEELEDYSVDELLADYDVDHMFDVVYSFDHAINSAIDNFVYFCETHKVEDDHYQVTQTRRVPVER